MNISDRQIRIWGDENQKKIEETEVLVSGTGVLAQYILAGLVGLGFGKINFLDNERVDENFDFLIPKYDKKVYLGRKKTQVLQEILKSINRESKIEAFFSKPFYGLLEKISPTILIEASNDVHSKQICYDFYNENKNKKNITFFSAFSNHNKGVFVKPEKIDSALLRNFNYTQQNTITSGVTAGLLLDEVRKEIFKIDNGEKLMKKEEFFQFTQSKIKNDYGNILVVGAGALGNFVTIALSPYNTNMHIVDDDIVEIHNLNRQIMFYDAIGKEKAKILEQRIQSTNPTIKVTSEKNHLDEYNIANEIKKYDAIIGCVDNVRTRFLLNKFAVKNKKIYIDGRTDQSEGELTTFYPGRNHCINCRKNFEDFQESRRSCADLNVMPSVVTSNMLIGTLLAEELLSLNLTNNYSKSFSSYSNEKIMLNEDYILKNCGCAK